MTRAFFIECSGAHWIGIGRSLRDKHGIEAVLWTADQSTVQALASRMPHAALLHGVDAACNRLPPVAESWPREPLDGPTLRALAADEAIALSMMDRMDPATGAFDHDSRRRHWHDLLRTWSAALTFYRPDVVIFSIAPHIVFDWALYALCKHRGINTLMFERTSLPGRLLLLERFEDGCTDLHRAIAASATLGAAGPLSPAASKQIAGLRAGGAEALPPNYRKKLAERGMLKAGGRQAALGVVRALAFETKRIAHVLLRRKSAPPNYLLRETADGRLAPPTAAQWLRARWQGQAKKRALTGLLRTLAHDPVAGRPYVLLALHYQPERAIVPMAGALGDQLLIADMLSATLPPAWDLVVKEHPWQLAEMGRGELGRSAGFYRRLASIPNVVIASAEADTTLLLDGAYAVATATGSIGWQAIARGKPALVFGAAWYRGCPGSYAIDSLESCQQAMSQIAAGVIPPENAAETTLAAIDLVSIAGFLEPALEDVAGLNEVDAIAAMAMELGTAVDQQRMTPGAS